MKKNGFTLIELLGAIIILGFLALIAFPPIERNMKFSQDNVYKAQIAQIERAASDWGLDHLDELPDTGTMTITLNDLRTLGYIEKDVINPKTKEPFNDNMLIRITFKNNNYVYEVDESSIE